MAVHTTCPAPLTALFMSPLLSLLSRFTAAALLAFVAGSCSEAPASTSPSGLRFIEDPDDPDERPYYHDFGLITEGSTLEHTYRLENPYAAPVSVTRLVPSCGCTVPSLRAIGVDGVVREGKPRAIDGPLLVVEQNETLEVTIRAKTSDIREKNSDKLFQLRMTTDGAETPFFTLEMHLFISAPWRVSPELGLNLGAIPMNGESSTFVDIVRAIGRTDDVVGLRELPEGVFAEITAEMNPAGEQFWRLRAGFHPPLSKGVHTSILVVETRNEDGEDGGDLSVQMRAIAVEDVRADPQRFVMRLVPDVLSDPPRISRATVLSLLPGHAFKIESATIEGAGSDALAISFTPRETSVDSTGASGRWDAVLSSTGVMPVGVHQGEVVFHLDDSQYPEVRVPYVLHARGGR